MLFLGNMIICQKNMSSCRDVYEELGKYGNVENQVLCRARVEELEPSIKYCLHKVGESNLETSELLDMGEMEGPALDLFKAKLEVSLFILVVKFLLMRQFLDSLYYVHKKPCTLE